MKLLISIKHAYVTSIGVLLLSGCAAATAITGSRDAYHASIPTTMAGNTSGTETSYIEKVVRYVRTNLVSYPYPGENLETVIAVRCSPSGTLLGAVVFRGSGNSQWDGAALRAVLRSDPMPLDVDGKAPASFKLTLRPD